MLNAAPSVAVTVDTPPPSAIDAGVSASVTGGPRRMIRTYISCLYTESIASYCRTVMSVTPTGNV